MSTDRFFFSREPSVRFTTYVGPSFVPHMKAVFCVLYTGNPSVCVFSSRKRSEEAAVSNFHSNIRTFVFIGRRRRRGEKRHKYCAQFWISPPHAIDRLTQSYKRGDVVYTQTTWIQDDKDEKDFETAECRRLEKNES